MLIDPMHDGHRKLRLLRPSFLVSILQGIAFFGLWSLIITYPLHIVVRPRLKGGDPAAGSPTATLLRLLPRC